MTIYAWIDYGYYDGLLMFSRLYVALDEDSHLRNVKVRWLGSEWEFVPEDSA